MKKVSKILQSLLLALIIVSCANFTGGGKEATKDEPEFVNLQEGQGIFAGKIYDDRNIIPVHEISFTGHTQIGGIRRESDDSINVLDFAKIKELEILKENYVSPRYQDKEYILAKTISNNGAITDDLLIPRNVVICAISTQTDMEKAWYLRKIKKIIIERDLRIARSEALQEKIKSDQEEEKEETFFGKIKRGFSKATKAIEVK
ncbi:hypothetical protein GF385_01700 [Candidatus Dependentiae bacterium]|nr:hypothetical protein [Candidatus Dependentiae bacterium]